MDIRPRRCPTPCPVCNAEPIERAAERAVRVVDAEREAERVQMYWLRARAHR